MRRFTDHRGETWVASAVRESGGDYKGRFRLAFERAAGGDDVPLRLDEVRWNSLRTAERTIRTMSTVELRRRLRMAKGRTLRADLACA